ncbi:hypothetical protein JCM24511_09836 [Saitozyma sp. JCM 24511]|nr:hypothetical protein JCM24511_09836 [Saitozyma sp. JCM 24511]
MIPFKLLLAPLILCVITTAKTTSHSSAPSAPAAASASAPGAGASSSASSAAAAAAGPPPAPTPSKIAQPPVPNAGLTNNPSIYTLSPTFQITNIPTTREYWWDLEAVGGAPDGYSRLVYAVNGQYPGPLIEANEGDTIIVHVTNHLDVGQGIHWHGITQNGSPWMDGVPGVSQCVIAPNGGTFTYNFTVSSQYGSYWWHAHYSNTLADGLVGGLIIHSPNDPLKLGQDFDEERVLYVSDWVDVTSQAVVDALLTLGTFDGSVVPPQGDAILINGVGRTNCTYSELRHKSTCRDPDYPVIEVPSSKRIRFRVINTGAHAVYGISIDNHALEVIEVDDTAVWGPTIHEIRISPGQRYSFIVNTDQGTEGAEFWLRVQAVVSCAINPQEGLAAFRYSGGYSSGEPSTRAWPDLEADSIPCVDMDVNYTLTPRDAKDAPSKALQTQVLSSERGNFVSVNGVPFGGQGFNNISFQNQINYPLLEQVEDGHAINGKLVANVAFTEIGGGDIIINNLDNVIAHPFHLHGGTFWILGRGTGNITAKEAGKLTLNTHNPLRRDTLQMNLGEWALLRIITDNPGVWPLHCHIGWHLSEGKLAAIVVQPDAVKGLYKPPAWSGLCKGLDQSVFGPAK